MPLRWESLKPLVIPLETILRVLAMGRSILTLLAKSVRHPMDVMRQPSLKGWLMGALFLEGRNTPTATELRGVFLLFDTVCHCRGCLRQCRLRAENQLVRVEESCALRQC